MGGESKGRARRARREREKRAREQKRAAVLEEFGSAAAGIVRNLDRLQKYWGDTHDRATAADRARDEMHAAMNEAVARARGIGLVHAVSGLRMHVALLASVGAAEMLPAGLELMALTLAGVSGSPDLDEAEQAYDPEQVRRDLAEAVEAGCMIAFFGMDPADQDALIVFQTVEREILIRSGTYQHILLDTLRTLFSDSTVNSDCLAVLGFTGRDAVEVMAAVREQTIRNLQARADRMLEVRDRVMPMFERWQQGGDKPDPAVQAAVAKDLKDALDDLTVRIDEATVIDSVAVAAETGIAVYVVDAVLDAYTYKPVSGDDPLDRFFTGDNPLRTAPLVADGDGRRILVHDALALPAVREVIETRLGAAGKFAAYQKRRAAVAEDDAVDLLVGVFPGADVHRGFEYLVPDLDAPVPQTTPATYTKLGEGDGLLIVDDIAIIIEVKAAALVAKSRAGVPARLRGQLRDIVTNAAMQANRMRERIVEDGGLQLRDGTWLDLSNVREIHSIAVSLEDLSGVTTATAGLIDSGLLPAADIPWTVSVHDLRIICELLERPSELLFYLRRRTNPDATRKFLAVDELDLYLYALGRGLFVVPDPVKRAAAMPYNAKASVADKRRFTDQRATLIESRTEPLDAWYRAQTDPNAPSADKPTLNVDSDLLALVDALSATGEPGVLSTAATILEQDARWHRVIGRMPRDLARQGRLDGRRHSIMWLVEDGSGALNVLVLMTRAADQAAQPPALPLDRYLAAKKHQANALRAMMIVFDASGHTIEQVIFDNSPNGPNPELDRVAAGLRSLDSTSAKVPRPGREARPTRKRAASIIATSAHALRAHIRALAAAWSSRGDGSSYTNRTVMPRIGRAFPPNHGALARRTIVPRQARANYRSKAARVVKVLARGKTSSSELPDGHDARCHF